MTVFAWPLSDAAPWRPESSAGGISLVGSRSESAHSGDIQAVQRPNIRWTLTQNFPAHTYAERAKLDAFINRLGGQAHRAAIYDYALPKPLGTIATTGVTVASASAQFSKAVALTGMGANATLLAGDLFSVMTSTGFAQLCMCAVDVTATAGGTATVEITQQLRGSVAAAAALTLIKPTTMFILVNPMLKVPYGGSNACPPFSIDWIEVFR